jgi:deoxyribodipyrimidine photo-lyase
MEIKFDTSYNAILEKIDTIDPIKYGRTRNYIDGDVSYLSPYISRGVISTKQILEIVLKKGYKIYQFKH